MRQVLLTPGQFFLVLILYMVLRVQGIDKYIWLVGQIMIEPTVKKLMSVERGTELSSDLESADAPTPEPAGYSSSEVIRNPNADT